MPITAKAKAKRLFSQGQGQGQDLRCQGQGLGQDLIIQGQGLHEVSSRILEAKARLRGQQDCPTLYKVLILVIRGLASVVVRSLSVFHCSGRVCFLAGVVNVWLLFKPDRFLSTVAVYIALLRVLWICPV